MGVDVARLIGERGAGLCAPPYTPCGGHHVRGLQRFPLECFCD
jgi:hypothetical protein